MLEEIKKNWFVIVIALILVGATGFYIADQSKNTVKTKKVKGEQVVFSINNEYYSVKDFEAALKESLGESALYQIFRKELLSNVQSSDDIKADAKFKAESFITYIKQSQGQKGLDLTNKDLIAMGYAGIDELNLYYENEAKYIQLITDEFMKNYDVLFKEDVEENKPRLVSHILVKMEDPENPSEDELKLVETIEKALEEGKSFEEVAAQYSNDTSSGQQGGSIGVVQKDSSLVDSFKEAMLTLEKGETSDWVTSTYGKHLIKVYETDFEKLLKDSEYFTKLETKHKDLVSAKIWETKEAFDFKFANQEVEDSIKRVLGLLKEDN